VLNTLPRQLELYFLANALGFYLFGRFLSSLLFSPSLRSVRLPEVPCIDQQEKYEVGDENTWCHPLPAVELPIKKWPEDRCREERIRMRGDVNQHMQTPGSEFPEGPLQQQPHQEEHGEENDEAMGDIVEMMHILRDRRFRRRAVTEVGLFRQAECRSYPQNPE